MTPVAVAVFAVATVTAGRLTAQRPPQGPPPGQLVNIGGHSLHIHCVGPGGAGPTVILGSGRRRLFRCLGSCPRPAVVTGENVRVRPRELGLERTWSWTPLHDPGGVRTPNAPRFCRNTRPLRPGRSFIRGSLGATLHRQVWRGGPWRGTGESDARGFSAGCCG